MEVSLDRLESLFDQFVLFIKAKSGDDFKTFKQSNYLNQQEHYKYTVYEEARNELGFTFWRPEDIGTGKIQHRVTSAIRARVNHDGVMVDNNLVDWRKKDAFSRHPKSRELETALFNLYKNKAVGGIKADDSLVFQQLLDAGLSYQFIAYLFFLKEKNKYLPISQVRFDEIFEQIGVADLKTSGNASWENYSQFREVIKSVWRFLKGKDSGAQLLDAHSFLWIIGNHMKGFAQVHANPLQKPNLDTDAVAADSPLPEPIHSSNRGLSQLQWTEILLNREITRAINIELFQTLLTFDGYKAYGSEIAARMGITHHPLNSEVGRYAKRISEHYDIDFTLRNEQEFKYWDLFFNGWAEGGKFVWQLRPEIVEALGNISYSGGELNEIKYPDDLPEGRSEELFEGLKRTVTVNAYERNPKARQLCIKHWGAVCAVCEFDFGKTYGKIGKGFIHVHHLVPLHSVSGIYEVDPVRDLIPVCPNCHAMLHTEEPPLRIEELRSHMNESKHKGLDTRESYDIVL